MARSSRRPQRPAADAALGYAHESIISSRPISKTDSRSHLDITLASIQIFSGDGLLDGAELDKLLALAERDGVFDEDEKRVLGRIFAQAEQTRLDPVVAKRIDRIRESHAIS